MRRISDNILSKWIIIVLIGFLWMPLEQAWAAQDRWTTRLDGWEVRFGDSPWTSEGLPEWTVDQGAWEALAGTTIPQFEHAGNSSRYVWLRTELPAERQRDPVILLQVHEHYELYVGSELIETFGEPEKGEAARFHGTPVRLIALPESSSGEIMYLRLYSSRDYTGLVREAEWGNFSTFLLRDLQRDGGKWVFGWMFILTGIVGLYVYARSRGWLLFRSFGFFTLAIGVYSFCRTDSVVYFIDHPLFMLYLELLALFLIVIALLQLTENMFGPGKGKVIRRLWQVLLITDGGMLALAALGWLDTPIILFAEQMLIFFAMPIGLFHLFLAWRRRKQFAGVVLLGIVIFCVTAVLDIVDNIAFKHIRMPSFTYVGATIFVFLLIHILLKHVMVMSERVKEQEKLTLVGKLAAGVAHEVRNPLTVISGNLQLMKRRADFKPPIDLMLGEVERVNQIMKEFLVMAKPRHKGEYPLVCLEGIMADSLRLLEADWHDKQIRVEYICDEKTPSVRCNANHMRQVFINLLKNAAEAMPDGGRITVRLFQADAGQVGIEIADEGVGIAAEDWGKPGTPFYTTKEGGTGLGLMVSRKIMQDHEGSLVLRNGRKRGTIAELRLPAMQKETARHS